MDQNVVEVRYGLCLELFQDYDSFGFDATITGSTLVELSWQRGDEERCMRMDRRERLLHTSSATMMTTKGQLTGRNR
jgi:hypothetical protein